MADRDLSQSITDYETANPYGASGATGAPAKDLVAMLEESRFGHLQLLFNKVHESELAEMSVIHPVFGAVNLKNLIDFIWIHEAYHLEQMAGMGPAAP